MIRKTLNLIFFVTFFFLIFFVVKYYFSEKNIIYTNKSRATYNLYAGTNLPLLKNDTDNIIIYKNDLEEFKKKRKKRFWEKLISNSNE